MTLRKSMLGLTMVCALLLSAFAAANASAEGTTQFTCVSGGTQFSDPDCTTAGTGFGHVTAGTGGTPWDAVGTSAAGQVLTGTLAGVKVKLTCTGLTGTGTTTNTEGPPMDVKGTGIVLKYTGCTVTEPAGKSCVIPGGTITTNTLTSTTSLTSTPKGFVFSPPASGEFVKIKIEKCTVAALNGEFPVKGTETAIPKGAFLETTATSGTLTFGGNPATLVGTSTVTNSVSKTPLTVTPTTS